MSIFLKKNIENNFESKLDCFNKTIQKEKYEELLNNFITEGKKKNEAPILYKFSSFSNLLNNSNNVFSENDFYNIVLHLLHLFNLNILLPTNFSKNNKRLIVSYLIKNLIKIKSIVVNKLVNLNDFDWNIINNMIHNQFNIFSFILEIFVSKHPFIDLFYKNILSNSNNKIHDNNTFIAFLNVLIVISKNEFELLQI